jgi:2-polyprenyl-3-methyl-5-hydroxy-6-metoxy-1,4-benzoquinol methylase
MGTPDRAATKSSRVLARSTPARALMVENKVGALEIDDRLRAAIRDVPHFRDSQYVDLDVVATIDYFRRKFVDHIYLQPLLSDHVLVDVGTGYGWLAIALGAYTPCRVVAVDMDEARLEAARSIAKLLGLEGRIDWRVGAAENLPLATRESDVTFCIEVLEHVQRKVSALNELNRITKRYLVITTPNGVFPIIAHDTCLPFCHWLPPRIRNIYARLFGRINMQQGNRFWTPWDVAKHLPDFRRDSRFLHYKTSQDYFDLYPFYLPYDKGEWRIAPGKFVGAYLSMVSRLGRVSPYFLHSLAGTFERKLDR